MYITLDNPQHLDPSTEQFMDDFFHCETKQDIHYYYTKYLEQNIETPKIDVVNNLTSIIDGLNDLYYNNGTSPLSDTCYDELLDLIYEDFPEIQEYYNNKVGHDPSSAPASETGQEISLPFYMGSMNKLKNSKNINLWLQKYPIQPNQEIQYVMSSKLDGISALLYNNQLYSRGNGTKGRNISFLMPYLNGGGEMSEINYVLRGELIINKETFNEKYLQTYANARNLVCGILNRNYSEEFSDYYHNIDFVVYDIYDDTLTPHEKFNIIKSLSQKYKGIKCACYYLHKSTFDTEMLDKILMKMKNNYNYEIDGIVISQNCIHKFVSGENPKYSFAYKNNDLCVMMKTGIVDKVIWNVSKDNYYKPKIKLQEPIVCDSSKIEYVTGFNAKYIIENKIHKNTKLKIGLSGNVIPHIFKIIETPYDGPQEALYPNNENLTKQMGIDFIWNKNKVDLICLDKDNVSSVIKKNMVFFKSFDMKCGLQETTLINVYNNTQKYKLEDILSFNESQWLNIDKIGPKKAHGFIKCFQDHLDWNTIIENRKIKTPEETNELKYELLLKFCVGSQCFNRGFALKKIRAHLSCLYDLYLIHKEKVDLINFHNTTPQIENKNFILREIEIHNKKYKGITKESMESFLEGTIDLAKFMYNLCNSEKLKSNKIRILYLKHLYSYFSIENMSQHEIQKLQKSNSQTLSVKTLASEQNQLQRLNIVFSGFRNKEIEETLMKRGHNICDTINKFTNVLVVKDKTKTSSKLKKALTLGHVRIIDGKDFNINEFL